MNKQESDILNVILQYHCRNQRALAERCGFSLGMVNRSVKALQGQGFLTTDMELTEKARLEMAKHRPKNAVILAAGYGMRMVPINMETPKGLLEVEGEPLIERLIRQLHAVKVKEIYVVVGFKKEQYDYLVDRYGVKLVVNMEYAEKNNLHSLAKVLPQLGETYLMPCDLWCRENPFSVVFLVSGERCKRSRQYGSCEPEVGACALRRGKRRKSYDRHQLSDGFCGTVDGAANRNDGTGSPV